MRYSNIFEFYEPGTYPNPKKISYYGWESSDTVFSYRNYFLGYKEAAEATFNKFIEASRESRIDIQDTIGYPLLFLYRHSIEVLLKYLYFRLIDENGESKIDFIKKVNHNLEKAFTEVEPLISKNDKNGFLDILRVYVREYHQYDKDSFTMRYPTTKTLEPVHKAGVRIDVIDLKEKMDYLYEAVIEYENFINR